MSTSSFTNFSLYFEGENVFWFVKKLVDCPFDANNDSHCLDHVNFSHPQAIVPVEKPNIVEDVPM
jgi:hypothetical protein